MKLNYHEVNKLAQAWLDRLLWVCAESLISNATVIGHVLVSRYAHNECARGRHVTSSATSSSICENTKTCLILLVYNIKLVMRCHYGYKTMLIMTMHDIDGGARSGRQATSDPYIPWPQRVAIMLRMSTASNEKVTRALAKVWTRKSWIYQWHVLNNPSKAL